MEITYGVIAYGNMDPVNKIINNISEELEQYEESTGEFPTCQIVISGMPGQAFYNSTKSGKREIVIFEVSEDKMNEDCIKDTIRQFAKYDDIRWIHA